MEIINPPMEKFIPQKKPPPQSGRGRVATRRMPAGRSGLDARLILSIIEQLASLMLRISSL